jgi:ribosome assembly protein YihI (activator of Der GTPase)
MIKPEYVKQQDVRKMTDNKYKQGSFNIKSQAELEKLYKVAANLFNNMKDRKNAMKTLDADDSRSLDDKLYEISSIVRCPAQYTNTVNKNR